MSSASGKHVSSRSSPIKIFHPPEVETSHGQRVLLQCPISEDIPDDSELTVSAFSSGSCSYLSPFSANATFIVLGEEECQEDIFIKPKNLAVEKPEICIHPPTPVMPRTLDDHGACFLPIQVIPPSPTKQDYPKKEGIEEGVFSKLFRATNTVTMAPVMTTGYNVKKRSSKDPLRTMRRAFRNQKKRYSSPALNLPSFDKTDIREMMNQRTLTRKRSGSDAEDLDHLSSLDLFPGPKRPPPDFSKKGSFGIDDQCRGPGVVSTSRKISLDSGGGVCRPTDQKFMMKKRSYSVTESVSDQLDVKKESGSKIWKQIKGTGLFKVGKVASVFSKLSQAKNNDPKHDAISLSKFG